jgi:hypothetical protein
VVVAVAAGLVTLGLWALRNAAIVEEAEFDDAEDELLWPVWMHGYPG